MLTTIENTDCANQMTLEERCDLVLDFARVLYVNGQSTDEVVGAGEQVSAALGLRAHITPRWGELELQAEYRNTRVVRIAEASPSGMDMDRVASAMRSISNISAGRLTGGTASDTIRAIAKAPPSPTWLFALAAAAGAVALAVLFGVQHGRAAALIFVSAAAGAILRRGLARYSANVYLQPFCAAVLAGIVGGIAVRFALSSTLRLVAVCPCMVLVPGPHVLNGALDLIRGRISLGAARLLYAGLVIAAISAGVLIGLGLLGVSLPVDPAGRDLPVWEDITAAGVAVACYSVFYSTPLRMLPSPFAVGMIAHALRWVALTVLGTSQATGAFVACLIVGLVLTPITRRWHMPFPAIGFAAVVSMIPGVFLFRTASGLLQLAGSSPKTLELITGTLADVSTAVLIVLAMSFGLIVSKLAIDRLREKPAEARI